MKTSVSILAVIIIVLAIVGAYYFGVHHALAPTTATSTAVAGTTSTSTTVAVEPGSSPYYTNTATWQTYSGTQFSIAYPLDFPVVETNGTTLTNDWRVNSQDPGVKAFSLTVPAAFEPQTNFSNATLTVGYSQNANATANCLTQDSNGPPAATSTAVINGIHFTIFTSSDAGAGNLYKTTSYRTVHQGYCWAVEYTVHSAELANYPTSYDLTQYSDQAIDSVLDRIISTFHFT